jgi:anhydro-N-acetylmuramic acid kinase
VLLNIGGIANISVISAESLSKPVYGYDTGPGNTLMDAWIKKSKGLKFDQNGDFAKSGKIH